MLKSKAKVDQQASLLLSKAPSDSERRLKGYQLGNLYYQAREYEQAKKYLSQFLLVREDYAPAHKLMAQILERSSSQEDIKKSISYYKRSYELDESEKQLTLKICVLLLRVDTPPEQASSVLYWIEKAKMFYPTDPAVFNLQEKMLKQAIDLDAGIAQDDSLNNAAMEELLVNNLKSRPSEVSVRLKLLKCLEQSQKFDAAVDCISEVLMKSPYYDNFDWYNYTAGLLQFASKDNNELATYLYLLHSFEAARTALRNYPERVAVEAMHRLDQALHSCRRQKGSLVSALREELRAQQFLLSANLLVKRNADASCISALYVAAFSKVVEAADTGRGREEAKELWVIIEQLRANRLAQAGYLTLDRCPETDQLTWLKKLARTYFNKDGKTTLYSAVFGDHHGSSSQATSMFMADGGLDQTKPVMPDKEELVKHCSVAQQLYPDSLHHQTWLALRQYDEPLDNYMMELAPRLGFSPGRITQCEPESLSQMDLTIFLLHTTYAAQSRLSEHRVGERAVKVADLSPSLCSEDQSNWWRAVFESSNASQVSASMLKFGRQRQLISRGIQIVRLIDNHGLSVQMVCRVAQLLQAKLEEVKLRLSEANAKVIHLTHWVRQYWTEAVRMLKILFSNGTLAQPREKLFVTYETDLKPEDLKELLAAGRLWLALEMVEEDREDGALAELKELPQPIASYTAAQIYQRKADMFAADEDGKDIYLVSAKDMLTLTMDRLANDIRNPLNAEVEQALEKVEAELDGQSGSFFSAGESLSHTRTLNGSVASTPKQSGGAKAMSMRLSSTNRGTPALSVSDLSANRVRPSPERLELQVRSLATAHESLRATIHEERNMATESNKHMIDSVTQIFDDHLGKMATELKKLTEHTKAISDDLKEIQAFQQDLQGDIRAIKLKLDSPPTTSPTIASQPSSSDTQITFLQQQLAALTTMMATSLQHSSLRPPAHPTSLSGYGTPSRGTPPVFQAGLPENIQLGTYPHLQQQSTTPSRAQPSKPLLTQQEMQAAAVAAAEHGFNDREFYVDDGENYYRDDYANDEDYEPPGYVGAEGCNTIAYMPKTSASGKPMPQPGFFAQPERTLPKLAEPKPAEPGVPPNVLMDKHMLNKNLAEQKADVKQSPLVVNVPKNPITSTDPTTPTSGSKGKVPPSPAKSDTGSVHDSSFDPHFEPIIELPPEVAVVTGEEDENVLYECRAKLFRMADSEWKERGTGTVKLLECKDTPGKSRLLMRRDQVHKICLNHSIFAALNLVAMGDKGNAWIWSALDYAEPTPVQERFAMRFKTPEIANEFKKVIDLAREKCGKAETKDVSKATPTSKVEEARKDCVPVAPQQVTLSELFKPTDDEWKCNGCYLTHPTSRTECLACNASQPGLPSAPAEPAIASSPATVSTAGGFGFGTFKISTPGSLFGDATVAGKPAFGAAAPVPEVTSAPTIFGAAARPATSTFGMFGSKAPAGPSSSQSLFGVSSATPATGSSGLFGFKAPTATSSSALDLSGTKAPTDVPPPSSMSLFGTKAKDVPPTSSASLFGTKATTDAPPTSTPSLFGAKPSTFPPPTSTPSLFGAEVSTNTFPTSSPRSLGNPSGTPTTTLKPLGATPFTGTPSSTAGLFGDNASMGAPTSTPTSSDAPPTSATPPGSQASANTQTVGLFGTKATSTASTGLFTQPPKPASGQEGEEGSLLRSLLSENTSKVTTTSGAGFSMGGFSFTGVPKVDANRDSKPKETVVTTKPSIFAGFTGFPTTTSSSSAAFMFSTPSHVSEASGKPSPFTFTPAMSQGLLSPKSDMKQSSSAPLLGPVEKTPPSSVSKDDLSLLSPSKGNPEEECNAEFTPVIALPDLVEVTTGEEGEEKMFVERSKLYRLSDGEWKERGVGELKILRNPQTGACRLVMRRDQVLKLAANHRLFPDMKISSHNEKARMWAAQDFSEGELKSEMLLARFKTAELAQRFEEAFTEAVNSRLSTPTQSDGGSEEEEEEEESPAPVIAEVAPPKATLAELFKPKEGEWTCSGCAVKNKGDVSSCPCCSTAKPGTDTDQSSKEKAKPPTAGFTSFSLAGFPGAGKPTVTATDTPSTTTASTPAGAQATKASSGFAFTGFNFTGAITATNQSSKPAAEKPSTSADAQSAKSTEAGLFKGFNFASAPVAEKSFTNSSSGPVPVSPGNYVEEDGDGAHIHFEPVIDLPDLVEVKTGEEEEIELYVHRAKLYRFTNGEYKEKGLGDVKILKHKDTNKVRIILRREKVLKLACNHLITPEMTLRPMENTAGKAWIWYALDFAESAGTEELFAIRFKTAEIAEEFKACFDAAKKGEKVPEQTLKSVTPQKSRSRPASESHTGNRSRTASESQGHSTPGKSAIAASSSDTSKSSSLFGDSVVCSPANPKTPSAVFGTPVSSSTVAASVFGDKSASPSVFGGKSASPSVFGGKSASSSVFGGVKSSPKALFAMMAKSEAGQSGDNPSSSSASSGQQPKSRIPVQAGTSKGASTTKQEEPTSASTPGKSMIPLANKAVGVTGGKSLLAQAKFGPTSGDSTHPPVASFAGQVSKHDSPASSTNNNSNGVLFGAKPAPKGVVSGSSTSSAFAFGAKDAKDTSVFGDSGGRSESGQSDVEFVCENRPSEELVRKAKEFLLPTGFYLYQERKDCRGCIGCEANEDNVLDHLFYKKPYKKLPGLSLASRNVKTTQSRSKQVEKAPSEENTFAKFADSVDFSLLSATSNPNAFQKTQGFKWSGAGSTLFGASSGPSTEDAENPETFEAETDFKPVIENLPELIELRTGEEDEEKIFCNRAKMYKFDKGTNEWKERGVGELKLLKHAENGTVRILLRREQVFKLVCNHLVQPSINLKPLATSETAWCWFAQDYSDTSSEDVGIEQFAVRFKNITLAKEFKQKFEESQEFVRQAQEARAKADTVGKDAQETRAELPTVDTGPVLETPAAPSLLERPTGRVEDEDEGDDDDDEEDDSSSDEEEIRVLYERQVTLYERQGSKYESLGIKMLQVVEENVDIIGGMAVYVLSDEDMDCRQLIFQETPMATVEKKVCSWHMYDFLTERPHLKYFQAKFASTNAAKEFSKYITQGIAYAKTMQLKEAEAIHTSMATNPIELNLSPDGVTGLKPK